jgi:hypothetical protein
MTMFPFALPGTSDQGVATLDASSRLRLAGCRLEHGKGGTSRVVVDFEGPGLGQHVSGVQNGMTSVDGDLRLTAQATLDAVTRATNGRLQMDLMGVKLVRAFDTTVIVVSVFTPAGHQRGRMVGAAIVDDDVPTTTVKATLHAINRFVAPYMDNAA